MYTEHIFYQQSPSFFATTEPGTSPHLTVLTNIIYVLRLIDPVPEYNKRTSHFAALKIDLPRIHRINIMNISGTFPEILYCMIIQVEKEGLSEIISFAPHGRSFVVHNLERFEMELMPRFFINMTRHASFQRQLNLYGFKRISEGPDAGGYWHRKFLRGRHDLVLMLKRKSTSKVRRALQEKAEAEEEEAQNINPANFYAMPPISPCPNKESNEISASSVAIATNFARHNVGGHSLAAATGAACSKTAARAPNMEPDASQGLMVARNLLSLHRGAGGNPTVTEKETKMNCIPGRDIPTGGEFMPTHVDPRINLPASATYPGFAFGGGPVRTLLDNNSIMPPAPSIPPTINLNSLIAGHQNQLQMQLQALNNQPMPSQTPNILDLLHNREIIESRIRELRRKQLDSQASAAMLAQYVLAQKPLNDGMQMNTTQSYINPLLPVSNARLTDERIASLLSGHGQLSGHGIPKSLNGAPPPSKHT